MELDIIDTPLINPNLSPYEKFFDHEWAKDSFAVAKNTPLEDAVNALVMAWRSTNGAHILPWLMVESLKTFAQGELDGNIRYRVSYSDQVVKGFVNKLEGMMQYSLKLDQRRALRRAVARIEAEAYQAIKTAREQVRSR